MSSNPVPRLSAADMARFFAKVKAMPDGACWDWIAAKDSDGYGVFSLNDTMFKAHRVSVRIAGYSLPTDAVVDHICRKRSCVNPDHLRTVDRMTNVHENSMAVAHLNSEKVGCKRGHPLSGENLYVKKDGRRQCRTCERARLTRFRLGGDSPASAVTKGHAPEAPLSTPLPSGSIEP